MCISITHVSYLKKNKIKEHAHSNYFLQCSPLVALSLPGLCTFFPFKFQNDIRIMRKKFLLLQIHQEARQAHRLEIEQFAYHKNINEQTNSGRVLKPEVISIL